MSFEPAGGFPPIIRKSDVTKVEKTVLESRGFSSINPVTISAIMQKKKDSFFQFGSEDESGAAYDDSVLSAVLFDDKPASYDKISYKEY